jgi:hypothetical protein
MKCDYLRTVLVDFLINKSMKKILARNFRQNKHFYERKINISRKKLYETFEKFFGQHRHGSYSICLVQATLYIYIYLC